MYTEYQPSHLLVPYIDSYWEFKGNPDYGMRIHILPDGCTDFIFTLGEVANAVEEGSLIMQPYRSYFVGPMTKYWFSSYLVWVGVKFSNAKEEELLINDASQIGSKKFDFSIE